MVPPVYVIGTTRTPNKTKQTVERFKKVGVCPKVWNGFHGEHMKICSGVNARIWDKQGEDITLNHPVSPTQLSLVLNFIALSKAILLFTNDAEVIICEDDANPVDDFVFQYTLVRAQLPDDYSVLFLYNVDGQIFSLRDNLETIKVYPGIMPLTHALLYSRKTLEKIVYAIEREVEAPIDILLIKNRYFGASYFCEKTLVTQRTHEGQWPSSGADIE